jgi:hypothetical protein
MDMTSSLIIIRWIEYRLKHARIPVLEESQAIPWTELPPSARLLTYLI